MIRVAVLVSGGGTNLQALIDAKTAGKMPNVRLVAVIASKAGVHALQRAQAAEIATCLVEKNKFANAGDFDAALLAALREYRVELVVLAGFLPMIGPQVLRAYAGKMLNVHPSLLPAFGGQGYYGLRVHRAALERGVRVSGATVHLVTEVVDGGEILLQKAVPVLEDDTPEALQKRVMEQAEWQILPQAVEALCASLQKQRGGAR